MNIATFNDRFKEMFDVLARASDHQKAAAADWLKWVASPLVVHTLTEKQLEHDPNEDANFMLPFPMFRAHVSVDGREVDLLAGEWDQSGGPPVRGITLLFRCPPNAGILTSLNGHQVYLEYRYGHLFRAKDHQPHYLAFEVVERLSRDMAKPSNYIVEAKPDREGKSVEWVKARTHFTIISHDHPANSAKVIAGARVAAGALTRSAHNRRAHFKTLRSPRYRFARGKTVLVRATWVGPKEWRDEGGRQIYRIVEPPPFDT